MALTKDKKRNVAFALVILQRRLASSTYALHESLVRRKKKLQDILEGVQEKKILIFTESRDTLEYLEKKTREWGYLTNTIHGGMKLEDRIKAESVFKNETQVLVATEAAGEGINLQFCHLMLNYDIPWNPNRLEQRMGRIHRYGQHEEVYVFNLVAEDTREGMVVNKVFQKIEEIKRAMGDDKVFDVISEVLYNKSLSQLLMEAAANARKIDDILKDLDITIDEDYIAKVKENLGDNLATRYIDYTRIKEMAQKAREYRLIPEYTENFFKKAFVRAEGKIKERNDGFLSIESIPYEIRRVTEQDNFRKSFGGLLKKYPKVTFDKEIAFKNPDAEFFSFGHPLFEAVMIWIENNFSDVLLNGATFSDPDGKMNGYILFYEGEVNDGKGEVAGKRLFGFFNDGIEIKSISPGIIWELAEEEKEERKNEYEKALIVLKDEIQKEKSLTMSMPRFIGIIRVIPSDRIEKAMQRDDEIERIGMEVAMEYERRNGRVPEDVADENLGFDIRSIDASGKLRYIEVKARAETGAVALTQPEWFKALRFKDDYYLYAVMNAGGNPRLYFIQNPSETLEHEEKVEVVRFIVPFKEIIEKGEEADRKIV